MNQNTRGRTASLTLLADVLTRILNAEGEASSILATLPTHLHPDAVDVLANVGHFISDDDIRLKHESYKDMQEGQMRQLIASLRSGAPREALLAFSFLGP